MGSRKNVDSGVGTPGLNHELTNTTSVPLGKLPSNFESPQCEIQIMVPISHDYCEVYVKVPGAVTEEVLINVR